MTHYISNELLTFGHIESLLNSDIKLKLSEEAKINIHKSHTFFVDNQLVTEINQPYLLESYACGMGDFIPDEIVKLMIFLKIQSFCYGFSGIRFEIIERLLEFYNNDVLPVVYSIDTPDDRIALAHLALPLIGKGEVRIKGKIFSASELENKFGWRPLLLYSKEIETLLAGTQLTTAYAVHNLIKSLKISKLADWISSLSVQIFGVNQLFFSEQVQLARPHKGQVQTAENIRNILTINTLENKNSTYYEAFCAIPQVHGAVKDSISHVRRIIKTEINSSTDDLLYFAENQLVIPSGNSHTLPLSLSLDFLAIALTSLGNITERRIFHLISSFQSEKNDKNDEKIVYLSIFQRISEGILAENKRLSMPISVESPIFTEKTTDIKGMGASSALKCFQIIKNIEKILAIELLTVSLIQSINEIHFESEIFNQYASLINFNPQELYLKKNIEQTICFFEENEALSNLLKTL